MRAAVISPSVQYLRHCALTFTASVLLHTQNALNEAHRLLASHPLQPTWRAKPASKQQIPMRRAHVFARNTRRFALAMDCAWLATSAGLAQGEERRRSGNVACVQTRWPCVRSVHDIARGVATWRARPITRKAAFCSLRPMRRPPASQPGSQRLRLSGKRIRRRRERHAASAGLTDAQAGVMPAHWAAT